METAIVAVFDVHYRVFADYTSSYIGRHDECKVTNIVDQPAASVLKFSTAVPRAAGVVKF